MNKDRKMGMELGLDLDERTYLELNQSLTFDLEGNEIFCGLTYDESVEYRFSSVLENYLTVAQNDRYLALSLKHELVRFAFISFESAVRARDE